jgi:hypothetical protein
MQLSPEQVQAVNLLLSAVQVAQRRGAYSLQDAHTLQEAIDKLVPREQQTQQDDLSQSGGESTPEATLSESVSA